jgi:methyl-accepting chemotaxis protein
MTDRRVLARLFAVSLRKRIFGGFALVLALLAAMAAGALQNLASVGVEAARVSRDDAQTTAATDVALQVADAHALVTQYALSANLDDQRAAQASLERLDQTTAPDRGADAAGGSDLQALATRYRGSVNASITEVEARRLGIEQFQAAETDLRTIISGMVELGDRETDPAVLLAIARVVATFGASDGAASRFIASRTPAEANAAGTALQELRSGVDALAGVASTNRRIQRMIKGMAEPLDRFSKALQVVVAADERLRLATAERTATSAAVLDATADLRNHAVQSQTAAVAGMVSGTRSAYRRGVITAAGAIGIGLMLALLIGRSIARPVQQLTAVMRLLADGNLDVAIPNTQRHDELGEMARAVMVFRDHMVRENQLAAEQDAERRSAEEEKRAALVGMADTIETETNTSLRRIMAHTTAMATTADTMSASATRTGASAQDAAAAAARSLASAQTVASAAEELAASIHEIGGQMELSSAAVRRAVTAGSDTRATIEALNREVESIDAVTDMIATIAAKTNLLALNATIEAARAGDAGRGFAVVASEVKGLAGQTARSTADIARHIGQVRAATSASVAAVARIEQTITEMSGIAGSVAAAVERQGAATAEIARCVTATASAVTEMTGRIEHVSSEAVATGQHACDVRDGTLVLNQAAEDLRSSVIRVVRTSTTEVDRRQARRRTADLPARLSVAGRSDYVAQVSDLSEGGACLRGGPDLPAGTRGTLRLDGVATPLACLACGTDNNGLHLAFENEPAPLAAIRSVLDHLASLEAA